MLPLDRSDPVFLDGALGITRLDLSPRSAIVRNQIFGVGLDGEGRGLGMTEGRPILGIDIGGTNLGAAVATPDGRVLASLRRPSQATDGPDAMIDRVVDMGRAAIAETGVALEDVAAIGISCGGPLDPPRGLVLNALNNPGWVDVPVVDRVQAALGRPTYLENDANAAALAEHRFGAGRGVRNLVYLTISTGLGGGAIVDGRLIHGEDGNAGELGHLVVRVNGRPCHCGSFGCIEAYCSGTSIAERAREALSAPGSTSRMHAAGGSVVRAEDVVLAARADDPLACALWAETTEVLGAGIVSMIHAFNPRLVLMGGGVAKAGNMLFEPIRRIVSEQAMPWLADRVAIEPAQLGDLSGVLGAVVVALDGVEAHGSGVSRHMAASSSRKTDPADDVDVWDEHQRVVSDSSALRPQVRLLAEKLFQALESGHKLITFGNGGSAAEAQHFAAELLGRFGATRRPLPAIALTSDPSTITAIANDFGYEDVFARQVEALAEAGDVAIGITTSGGSESVVRGLRAARARGAVAVAWTGANSGRAGEASDLVLAVPSTTTARIQEVHTLATHTICGIVDSWASEGRLIV